jgi:hypothetical protein
VKLHSWINPEQEIEVDASQIQNVAPCAANAKACGPNIAPQPGSIIYLSGGAEVRVFESNVEVAKLRAQ